jgi:hypothetical protein
MMPVGTQPMSDEPKPLTPTEAAYLDFYRAYAGGHGYPPAVRDFAAHFGVRVNAATGTVNRLIRKGVLRRDGNKGRGLSLPQRTWLRYGGEVR